MGKSKSLGYQIHSALNVINLQESEKRTELFNKLNGTDFQYVGKREFKKLGQTKEFIFSKRTAENTTEKAKTFCTFLKENYNIKLVRDITPDMAICAYGNIMPVYPDCKISSAPLLAAGVAGQEVDYRSESRKENRCCDFFRWQSLSHSKLQEASYLFTTFTTFLLYLTI